MGDILSQVISKKLGLQKLCYSEVIKKTQENYLNRFSIIFCRITANRDLVHLVTHNTNIRQCLIFFSENFFHPKAFCASIVISCHPTGKNYGLGFCYRVIYVSSREESVKSR